MRFIFKIFEEAYFELNIEVKFKSEDLIAICLFLILKSKIPYFISNLDLIENFMSENILNSVSGYYLTNFKMALYSLIQEI